MSDIKKIQDLFQTLKKKIEECKEEKEFIIEFRKELNSLHYFFGNAIDEIRTEAHENLERFLTNNKKYLDKIRESGYFEILLDKTNIEINLICEEEETNRIIDIEFYDSSMWHSKERKVIVTINDCEPFYMEQDVDLKTIIDKTIKYYNNEIFNMSNIIESYKETRDSLEKVVN